MKKRHNRTYRFETLHHNRDRAMSLSTLNAVLKKAQKDLPPRTVPRPREASDQLALSLLTRVKLQFKCSQPARWVASLQLGDREMVGPDA